MEIERLTQESITVHHELRAQAPPPTRSDHDNLGPAERRRAAAQILARAIRRQLARVEAGPEPGPAAPSRADGGDVSIPPANERETPCL